MIESTCAGFPGTPVPGARGTHTPPDAGGPGRAATDDGGAAVHDRDRPGTPWTSGRPRPGPHPSAGGVARADPDGLDAAAATLDRIADALTGDAALVGPAVPVPGFAAGTAAAAWEDAMVRAVREHAGRTASTASALRAAAAAWRATDDDAAVAFAGRAS